MTTKISSFSNITSIGVVSLLRGMDFECNLSAFSLEVLLRSKFAQLQRATFGRHRCMLSVSFPRAISFA